MDTDSSNSQAAQFDPAAWEGDPDELGGVQERLANDPELCDSTFGSRYEAFTAGLYLGETGRHRGQAHKPR